MNLFEADAPAGPAPPRGAGWAVRKYLNIFRVSLIACLPYGLLFFLCRGFFDGFPDGWTLAAYVAALLLAFVVGFFFEACIGMIGFWFLEVTSLLYVVNILNFFISGQMLPLDLLSPF